MPRSKSSGLSLPPQITSFIGRSADLAEISSLLATPTCRLLTLIGPGGIGKTRLAVEVAASSLDNYPDGVTFAALQPLHAPEFIAPTIAEAVALPLSGHSLPDEQILDFLRDKQMLLVLDNFEHLIEGAPLLAQMLQVAPRLKLVVTSREALNLQEEWLYPLDGLPYPRSASADRLEEYSAVRLFVERARQVRRDFSLDDEHECVVRICRLVEGMPLALELAAAWTKMLDCGAIAAEIEANLDFLASNLRNIPDRHRSMRATFDYSWRLLSQEEQVVFRKLSVFLGGFSREAAARVAGASLPVLTSLVDRSLLRRDEGGRYQMHELVRQFTGEKLAEPPDDLEQVREDHARYYADFLYERRHDLGGRRQREAVKEIAAEIENIRFAIEWSIECGHFREIDQGLHTMMNFYEFQSRFAEGAAIAERVLRWVEAAPPSDLRDQVLVQGLVAYGWFGIRLGHFDRVRAGLARACALQQQGHSIRTPYFGSDPLSCRGVLACLEGDYDEAIRLGHAARQNCLDQGDQTNLPLALYVLADAYLKLGQFETAWQHAHDATRAASEQGNRWFLAYCLVQLGDAAQAMERLDTARLNYEASYTLRAEFDDPEGMARALNALADLALGEGDAAEARRLYGQSLALYHKTVDPGGLASTLGGYGVALWLDGAYEQGRDYLQQALRKALEIRYQSLVLSLLIGIAELLVEAGKLGCGVAVSILILRHPQSGHAARAKAQRLLERCGTRLSIEQVQALAEQGAPANLDTVAERLLDELAWLDLNMVHRLPIEADGVDRRVKQTLVEPLTERELEVLRLVAQGHSNQQIARELIISLGTVKAHVHNIYGKLAAENRVQAVSRATDLGLVAVVA